MSDFEKDLLYFASPALLGRKQANLFSFSINCLTDYRKEIDRYKKELAPLGISVEYLYCKKQRVYLLVYRRDMMLHYFKQPAVKEFLIKQVRQIPRCTADGNTADADANARIPHRIVERSTPRNG